MTDITTDNLKKALSLVGGSMGKEIMLKTIALRDRHGKVAYGIALHWYGSFVKHIAGYQSGQQLQLLRALLLTIDKHDGQFYQWHHGTVLPYAVHCAMAALAASAFSDDAETIIVGLWHDLLEDKRATAAELGDFLVREGIAVDIILPALFLLDGTGRAKYDYYGAICGHERALIVKTGDLLANLDACNRRLEEMRHDESRFWIYAYVFEVHHCLFQQLSSSHLSRKIVAKLSSAITELQSRFTQDEHSECTKYLQVRHNEITHKP
ncbi:hypothetical protein HY639_02760 [Candidatus Woesearchaeota archaeon]|nr:hypothetical protein [Candidatus Woesearchaeota archaeon]